jgi:hypothetical protein
LKDQQTGIGPSAAGVAVFIGGAPAILPRGRLAGGAETQDLIVGAGSFGGGQRRWGALALAVMAGIACLGFGGRWSELGGPDRAPHGGAAVASVAPPGGAWPSAASMPTKERAPIVASAGGLLTGLPVGFAVARTSPATGALSALVVVGFVAGRQTVAIRLLDRDGAVLARRSIAGGSTKAATALWGFQAPFDVPRGTRLAGPDDKQIEVRWTDASGAATLCSVAAAAGPIASERCTTDAEWPSQLEPSGRLRRTIP